MIKTISERIKAYFIDCINEGKMEVDVVDANADLQRIIDEVEKTGGWIPCSERLPEEKRKYLVSHGTNYDVVIEGFNGMYFDCVHSFRQPLAWMPLPEPYRGKQE